MLLVLECLYHPSERKGTNLLRVQNSRREGSYNSLGFGNTRDDQFSLVAQSCPILCDPMDYSTPGLPVHHQLPELAEIHVR